MIQNTKNTEYYLYAFKPLRNNEPCIWQCVAYFPNKQKLIEYIADSIDRHNSDDSYRWTSVYFDELNMNWKDSMIISKYVPSLDSEGNHRHVDRVFLYDELRIKAIYPYCFVDEHNRIIDVRTMREEVIDYLRAVDAGLIKVKRKSFYQTRYGRRQHRKRHKCVRYHSGSHFYRTLKQMEPEVYDFGDDDITVYNHTKYAWARSCWWDDFITKDECGWKTHKNKKQWMHNANRQKHIYVDNNYDKMGSSDNSELPLFQHCL